MLKAKVKTAIRFVSKYWLTLTKEEVLVIGDSHSDVFNCEILKKKHPKIFFNVNSVHGATLSGLQNPKSKTQANNRFLKVMNDSRAKKLIINLGEVDTGFVIWFWAEKNRDNPEVKMTQAIENYRKLIGNARKKFKVICISAPLPTLKDYSHKSGGVADLRKSINATQEERTSLTLKFNSNLKALCDESNATYLDLDAESLGENGLVIDELIHADPNEHHYDQTNYGKLISKKLQRVL